VLRNFVLLTHLIKDEMKTEKVTKLKVAIIGLGNIGQAVATNLVKSNRQVIVATRDTAKAKTLSGKLGSLAQAKDVEVAIKESDIIVLAVWFNAIEEILFSYKAELKGKIIIDPSNPIAPDNKGGFKKIIGEKESAGLVNKSLLPKGAKLVKALGTLGAASLTNAYRQKPEYKVLFYANDDTSLNDEIDELIMDCGFEPIRIGGIDQSIRIEVFGDLHEFGALGKTVTRSEAESKL
jgi:predicted dinucleotide-binding enzyme